MVRRYLRSLVVRAPHLQDFRNQAQRTLLKAARKPFEPEFEVLEKLDFANGECALDIGGNRGQSIDAIRLYRTDTPIFCFEPNPELAERLEEQFSEDANISILAHGLSEEEDEVALYIPYYGDYMFDGLASIDRAEARDWLSAKTLVGFDENKLRIRELSIALKSMDSLNLKPGFVKIDVQGAEAAVIAGAASTIAAYKPVFLVETGLNEELITQMEHLGYRAFNYENKMLVPRTVAKRNTIFGHPDAMRGLESVTA